MNSQKPYRTLSPADILSLSQKDLRTLCIRQQETLETISRTLEALRYLQNNF